MHGAFVQLYINVIRIAADGDFNKIVACSVSFEIAGLASPKLREGDGRRKGGKFFYTPVGVFTNRNLSAGEDTSRGLSVVRIAVNFFKDEILRVYRLYRNYRGVIEELQRLCSI